MKHGDIITLLKDHNGIVKHIYTHIYALSEFGIFKGKNGYFIINQFLCVGVSFVLLKQRRRFNFLTQGHNYYFKVT